MSEGLLWDRIAGRYDLVVRLFNASYPEVRKRLEDDLGGVERILEVGAGTGQFTFALGEAAGFVLATDLSRDMVERLGEKLAQAGMTNVTAEAMSAYELSVDDETFNAVVCANALHVMDDPRRALSEFHRVLKPGGRLIAPTFLHGADAGRRALSKGLSLLSPFVAHTRFDLAGLCKLVESEGFEVTQAHTLSGLFPIGYVVAVSRPAHP